MVRIKIIKLVIKMVDSVLNPGATSKSGSVYFNHLYRFLDENGDDTGNKNADGDYSGVGNDIEFFSLCPVGFEYVVHRLVVYILDTGSPDAGFYGNNITLTEGVVIQKLNSSDDVLLDITDGFPVTTNSGWSRFSYDVQELGFGSGTNAVACRFSFDKSGRPIILRAGERLAVILNDNFSGLVEHTFHIQGLINKRIV